MKMNEVSKSEKGELKKWSTILEASQYDFHTLDWLKFVEMDFDTYLTRFLVKIRVILWL